MDGNKSSRALPLCGLVRPVYGIRARPAAKGALQSLYLPTVGAGVVYLLCFQFVLRGLQRIVSQPAKVSGRESKKELAFVSTRLLLNVFLLSGWQLLLHLLWKYLVSLPPPQSSRRFAFALA